MNELEKIKEAYTKLKKTNENLKRKELALVKEIGLLRSVIRKQNVFIRNEELKKHQEYEKKANKKENL